MILISLISLRLLNTCVIFPLAIDSVYITPGMAFTLRYVDYSPTNNTIVFISQGTSLTIERVATMSR